MVRVNPSAVIEHHMRGGGAVRNQMVPGHRCISLRTGSSQNGFAASAGICNHWDPSEFRQRDGDSVTRYHNREPSLALPNPVEDGTRIRKIFLKRVVVHRHHHFRTNLVGQPNSLFRIQIAHDIVLFAVEIASVDWQQYPPRLEPAQRVRQVRVPYRISTVILNLRRYSFDNGQIRWRTWLLAVAHV